MAGRHPVVVVQQDPSSSASSLDSISTSNPPISRSNSVSSTGSQTRPARQVDDGREFVETGRPQGGNPHGGPPQNDTGYYRATKGAVTVHNSGGQSVGTISTDMGPACGNGLDHTDGCRALSQKSDNMTLCFCPTGPRL